MIDNLAQHFSSYAEPVIGVSDEKIVFLNPAAKKFISGLQDGDAASSVFPADLLEAGGDTFAGALTLGGRSVTVAVSELDGIHIFRISGTDPTSLDAVGPMLTNLSEEMRETLSVLSMACELLGLQLEEQSDPVISRNISMIYHSYFQLMRLSGNLSRFFSINRGEEELRSRNTNIVQFLSDLVASVKSLIKRMDIELGFFSPLDFHIVAVDREKMEQLILNLLSNSLKYTDPGGAILMSVKVSGGNVVITVKDSGKGITPDTLEMSLRKYAYEKDFTDVFGGMGLGISLASGIAELHGGILLISSQEDEGTMVTVTIPDRVMDTGVLMEAPEEQPEMRRILTELSDVLTYDLYTPTYLD